MKEEKIECPICHGKGQIKPPMNTPKDLLEKRQEIAHALRNEGYSIREIMGVMNYKSPRSVQILLEEK